MWGPTGAPGRTTVAITLADELARLGQSSLLVDADVYGGTIAAELGLLDESPGLAAACRLAAGTRLTGAALAGLCWQLSAELRVLTGIPLAARWTELRTAAVTAVLAAARQLADVTVVDCGFCLETDEELSFDSLAPRRNGATLAVLDDADEVLVVGAADPVGMQRLVRGLAELRDAEVGTAPQVVLNKVRRGVVPGRPARRTRRRAGAVLGDHAGRRCCPTTASRSMSRWRPGVRWGRRARPARCARRSPSSRHDLAPVDAPAPMPGSRHGSGRLRGRPHRR